MIRSILTKLRLLFIKPVYGYDLGAGKDKSVKVTGKYLKGVLYITKVETLYDEGVKE